MIGPLISAQEPTIGARTSGPEQALLWRPFRRSRSVIIPVAGAARNCRSGLYLLTSGRLPKVHFPKSHFSGSRKFASALGSHGHPSGDSAWNRRALIYSPIRFSLGHG